jgi:hypothetical protein
MHFAVIDDGDLIMHEMRVRVEYVETSILGSYNSVPGPVKCKIVDENVCANVWQTRQTYPHAPRLDIVTGTYFLGIELQRKRERCSKRLWN